MIDLDGVNLAQTELAKPMVFTSKKWRHASILQEQRKINTVTAHDSFPIPRIDEFKG